MFQACIHPQSTSEWSLDLPFSESVSAPACYRADLVARLRAEREILLKLIDGFGHQLAYDGDFNLQGRLGVLESRLLRYLLREPGELFAFLEPKVERRGFEEREIVRERHAALLMVYRDLLECRRTADAAALKPMLRRTFEWLRHCFE